MLKASYVRDEANIEGGFAGIFGKIAGLYFQKYGDQSDALAMIAAKNHKNGVGNPYAQLRKDLGFEFCRKESDKNPFVAGPLKRTDCSLVSDGAAAIVLADVETALALDKAIAFRAAAHVQDFLPMAKRDILKFEGCALAWKQALAQAGIALDDLSFVETHDCFTIAELIEYEAMGLVPEGQGARAIAEGLDAEGRQAAGQSVRRAEGQGPSDRRDRRVDACADGDAAAGHGRRHPGEGREARRHLQHGRRGGRELREHSGADQVAARSLPRTPASADRPRSRDDRAITPPRLPPSSAFFSATRNCERASSAKAPSRATSSSKLPVSTTRPSRNTRMRVALRMVESRCAITKVVRSFITSSSAACTLVSVVASSAEVASSRIRIGGFFSSARAIDSRWRSPPDRKRPRSPTIAFELVGIALDEIERLRAPQRLAASRRRWRPACRR